MSKQSIGKSGNDPDSMTPEAYVTAPLIETTGLGDADPWCVSGAVLLSRAARLWEQTLETVLKHHGLIPAEMRVLSALIADSDQELTMSEIKQSVAVTAGGVTKAVARLQAIGLLSKRSCARDGRVTIVAVNTDGRTRVRDAMQDVVANFAQTFRDADEQERKAISLALHVFAAKLPARS